MFDIFCHRITFVFENVDVDVNDLIDIIGEIKGTKVPMTKKAQIKLLSELFEARKKKNDRMSKKTADAEIKKL